jgi:hypothetical protein
MMSQLEQNRLKKSDVIINVCVSIASVYMFGLLMKMLLGAHTSFIIKPKYVILGLLAYSMLHMLKLVRYYLILSESHISIYEFAKLYIRFSLVNILIPKKLGEFYKVYAIARKCGDYKVALLSVFTQIYFDLISVSLIMMISFAIYRRVDAPVIVMFLLAVATVFLVYMIFPSTYKYLNNYFMVKSSKKRDVYALDLLSRANGLYRQELSILKGKGGIILINSLAIWLVEYVVFFFIAGVIGVGYNLETFSSYIGNIFVLEANSANLLLVVYTVVGSLVFALFFLTMVIIKYWREAKR